MQAPHPSYAYHMQWRVPVAMVRVPAFISLDVRRFGDGCGTVAFIHSGTFSIHAFSVSAHFAIIVGASWDGLRQPCRRAIKKPTDSCSRFELARPPPSCLCPSELQAFERTCVRRGWNRLRQPCWQRHHLGPLESMTFMARLPICIHQWNLADDLVSVFLAFSDG